MDERTNCVKLTGVCHHCHEAVDIDLSKKELKRMLQGFKMRGRTANILAEKNLQVKYEAELTASHLREAYGKLADEKKAIVSKALEILKETQ